MGCCRHVTVVRSSMTSISAMILKEKALSQSRVARICFSANRYISKMAYERPILHRNSLVKGDHERAKLPRHQPQRQTVSSGASSPLSAVEVRLSRTHTHRGTRTAFMRGSGPTLHHYASEKPSSVGVEGYPTRSSRPALSQRRSSNTPFMCDHE